MIYETNRIKRIIEYKDNLVDEQLKEDIEWILGCYNNYYADSKEFQRKSKDYFKILNKFYNSEEEKVKLKELIIKLRRKINVLKCRIGGN